MITYSKTVLMGNVGHCQIKDIPSGKKVAEISLATSHKTKNGETTYWHNIRIYANDDKALQYIKKGTRLAVSGALTYDEYENKQGQKVKTAWIVANDFQFENQKPSNAQGTDGVPF